MKVDDVINCPDTTQIHSTPMQFGTINKSWVSGIKLTQGDLSDTMLVNSSKFLQCWGYRDSLMKVDDVINCPDTTQIHSTPMQFGTIDKSWVSEIKLTQGDLSDTTLVNSSAGGLGLQI